MSSSVEHEVATLGGGCFWCLDAVYRQLKGVEKVVSGYAGGTKPNPSYREVCGGNTGHAEVVQITYDPSQISYRDLLDMFSTIREPRSPAPGASGGSCVPPPNASTASARASTSDGSISLGTGMASASDVDDATSVVITSSRTAATATGAATTGSRSDAASGEA